MLVFVGAVLWWSWDASGFTYQASVKTIYQKELLESLERSKSLIRLKTTDNGMTEIFGREEDFGLLFVYLRRIEHRHPGSVQWQTGQY